VSMLCELQHRSTRLPTSPSLLSPIPYPPAPVCGRQPAAGAQGAGWRHGRLTRRGLAAKPLRFRQLLRWLAGAQWGSGGAGVLVRGPAGAVPGRLQRGKRGLARAAFGCITGRSPWLAVPAQPPSHTPLPHPLPCQVTNVVLTAGTAGMRNASLYIGSDLEDIRRNALVAVRRVLGYTGHCAGAPLRCGPGPAPALVLCLLAASAEVAVRRAHPLQD
jgi:hypothetical protein